MFKNILIPTDGSQLAQKAVLKGVTLARSVGAKVTALFAAPPATPIVYRHHLPAGYATPLDHQELIDRTAATHLKFVERAAKRAGVRFEGVHLTSDFPEEAILKIAQQKKCDLIVIATHGEGGLRGFFLGSVTQKVLAKAKIPVMVLR
jgi:nucleotide-binding universal stress UspA family protein